MKIYTSYFHNLKKHPEMPNPFSISNGKPVWANVPTLDILVPRYSLVCAYKEGDVSKAQYETEYVSTLYENEITPLYIIDKLKDSIPCTLLCWESPEKFCHRHIVAKLLRMVKGIEVEEYTCK